MYKHVVMNLFDFGLMGSKVKGHVAKNFKNHQKSPKIVCYRDNFRTMEWIFTLLGSSMYKHVRMN